MKNNAVFAAHGLCALLVGSWLGVWGGTAHAALPPDDAAITDRTRQASDQVPEGLTLSEWAQIREQIRKDRHAFTYSPDDSAYRAHNAANAFTLNVDATGGRLEPAASDWSLGMRTVRVGRHKLSEPQDITTRQGDKSAIELDFGADSGVTEWYVNRETGIEHGWTLHRNPGKSDQIDIEVAVSGFDVEPSHAGNLRFVREGMVLNYSKLRVFDAQNRVVPATMAPTSGGFVIALDAQQASFPLTVDPLIQSAVLLPDEAGPNDTSRYGYAVALSVDGHYLIVGDDRENGTGAIYIYSYQPVGGWKKEARLRPEGELNDEKRFGDTVAIHGDTIFVGMPGDGKGEVAVIERNASGWAEVGRILSPAIPFHYSGFGSRISLDADRALIADYDEGVYVFEKGGQEWTHTATLSRDSNAINNGGIGLNFGHSIALNGDLAFVGDNGDDENGIDSGLVYIFENKSSGWEKIGELSPNDSAANDNFGNAIDTDGNFLIVGASYKTEGTSSEFGAAYIFRIENGSIVQEAKLTAPSPAHNDYFGSSVSIENSIAVVSAPKTFNFSAPRGSVFVFERDNGNWPQTAEIAPSELDRNDRYGIEIDVANGMIVASAENYDPSHLGRGAVYSFVSDNGNWEVNDRLTEESTDSAADDDFGSAVDLSDNLAAIGAPSDDGELTASSGSVTVFSKVNDGWLFDGKVVAPDAEDNARFGYSVAISDDERSLLVGAPNVDGGGVLRGAVYYYRKSGEVWGFEQKITADDSSDQSLFGAEVELLDEVVFISATGVYGSNAYRSGAVYVFSLIDGLWVQEQKLLGDNDSLDGFGSSLSAHGGSLIVGAPLDDELGFRAGAVYVFSAGESGWERSDKLFGQNIGDRFYFGHSVSVYQNNLIVGTPLYERGRRGIVYFFEEEDGVWSQISEYSRFNSTYLGIQVSVGPYFSAVSTSNSVDIWERTDGGWLLKGALNSPANGAGFGGAISVQKSNVLVGSPQTDSLKGGSSGVAFVYSEPPRDFGDAPLSAQSGLAADYPTQLVNNGARHELTGLYLGTAVDSEDDGQSNATATGDDLDDAVNDEDGVVFSELVIGYESALCDVTVSQANTGYINAFIDFNQDGDFIDAGEHIINDELVEGLTESIEFEVPADALAGTTFARVRVSSAGGDGPDGAAADGEVEDYQISLALPTLSIGDTSVTEADAGTSSLNFTISLSHAVSQDVSVDYATADGTATIADSDYLGATGSATISAGDTSGQVTVSVNGDTKFEDDEDLELTLSSPDGAALSDATATGVITNDDTAPTVSLVLLGSPLDEAGGTATVTANLSAVSGLPVTVNLAFSGSASSADYSVSANSIVIAAGASSGAVELEASQDLLDELDESIVVAIASVTNGTEDGVQQVSAIIADDDPPPAVTLSLDTMTMLESAGSATLTATLDAVSGKDVTVDLGFSGTAVVGGVDYNVSASSITIAQGAGSGFITLAAVQDAIDEANESIVVDIVSVTNGVEVTQQQQTASIVDDDDAPTVGLALSNASFAEAGGETTVTASLSALSGQDVTVNLAFAGTASATDYDTSATQILIPAGSPSGAITLTGTDDTTFEGDETVEVSIGSVTNGVSGSPNSVTATITDDDTAPSVSLGLTGTPFAEDGGVATVTASLSNLSTQAVTVDFGFAGSASGADYSASDTSITIAAGSSSGSITLTGVADAVFEGTETIDVTIDAVTNGTEDGEQSVTATITDDDTQPSVSLGLSGSPLAEDGGVATVTANLSNASTQVVTVDLSFAGTAVGSDYAASSAQIMIPAGSTSGTITLTGTDDTIFEGDETVEVSIGSVTNGVSGSPNSVTATITDDDTAPSVSLGLTGTPFAEDGGVATVTASLSNLSTQAVTVDLGFAGSASGADYSASDTSITIAAGSSSGSITLTGVADAVFEGPETIDVTIDAVTNGTEDGEQSVTATITDDDTQPSVSLGLSGSPLAEDGGVATVTANLSNASTQVVTVDLSFAGTAVGSDYAASSAQIMIPAGSTSGTITLTGMDDTIFEGNETIEVSVGSVTNGVSGSPTSVTATITDDDTAPTVSLGLTGTPFAEDGGVATVTASLSNLSTQAVTVDLGFAGSASGADYSASDTSITIAAGSSSGSIALTGVADAVFEGPETIEVNISSVTNGVTGSPNSVTATITDDDTQPSVSLGLSGSPLAEDGGVATVTANLSHPSTQVVTVDLSFAGSAGGGDYTSSSTQIMIPAESTSGTITLTGMDDTIFEGNETIEVSIGSVTNGVSGSPNSVTATITDDDPAPTPAPTPPPTPAPTPIATPIPTPVPTATATPTLAPTATPSTTPTPTSTPVVIVTPEPSPTVSPSPTPSPSPTAAPTPSPQPSQAPGRFVTTPGRPLQNTSVPSGSKDVPMLIFGIHNPNVEDTQVAVVKARIEDNDGGAALERVRLVLDENANGRADVGERILAETDELLDEGALMFSLQRPLEIEADARLSFVVLADFR